MLTVEKKQVAPDVIVLDLIGRVALGRSAQQLEWAIEELLKAKARKIVLDLTRVDHMDSTGIGIIVLSSGKVKAAGGDLRVGGAQGLVREVLSLTKVDAIIGIYPSAEDAVRSFTPGSSDAITA
jgi:anti-sigma B factor antagonist